MPERREQGPSDWHPQWRMRQVKLGVVTVADVLVARRASAQARSSQAIALLKEFEDRSPLLSDAQSQ